MKQQSVGPGGSPMTTDAAQGARSGATKGWHHCTWAVSDERKDLARRLLTPNGGVCGHLQEFAQQWSLSGYPGVYPGG